VDASQPSAAARQTVAPPAVAGRPFGSGAVPHDESIVLPPVIAIPWPPMLGEGAQFAGWWVRVASFLIDFVACAVPIFVAFSIAGAVQGANQPRILHPNQGEVPPAVVGGIFAGWFLLLAVYFTVLNGRIKGQTLGNLALGIAVRDGCSDTTIGLVRSFLRFFLRILLYAACVIPGLLNDLMPLWTKRRQSLADKMVRSVVVIS
jgi:uncharacterized RDD family membrane protein YckC